MSVLVLMVFGVVVLVGVVFIIYGLSQKENPQGKTEIMTTRRGENNMVEIIDGKPIDMADIQSAVQRLNKQQMAPNLIVATLDTLKGRVHTVLEKSLIKDIVSYCDACAKGFTSQATAVAAKRKLEEEIEYYNDHVLRGGKRDLERLKVEAEMARLQREMRDLNADVKKEGKGDDEDELNRYAKKRDKESKFKQTKMEKDIQDEVNRAKGQASKSSAYQRACEEKKEELFNEFENLHGPIKKWSSEEHEKYTRELANIEDTFNNDRARTF